MIKEILDGWKNYVFPSEETERAAHKRLAICATCPSKTEKNTCGECGCPLATKTRSFTKNNKCPKNKW